MDTHLTLKTVAAPIPISEANKVPSSAQRSSWSISIISRSSIAPTHSVRPILPPGFACNWECQLSSFVCICTMGPGARTRKSAINGVALLLSAAVRSYHSCSAPATRTFSIIPMTASSRLEGIQRMGRWYREVIVEKDELLLLMLSDIPQQLESQQLCFVPSNQNYKGERYG